MSYREQVSQFLKALSQSPDLDTARPVVEANLYLLHSPQFMPAFMATISQPEISDLERFLINLALTEILNTLDPGQLGSEGLIVALLFSEEDFSTLVGRYADYIDISACQQMIDLADALAGQADLPAQMADGAIRQLRRMAERFAMIHSMDYVRPLLEMQHPERDPQELLSAIVRRAQEMPPWLAYVLHSVSERMLASTNDAHARIGWLFPQTLYRAHQKLQQGANSEALTPVIHLEMFNALVEWAQVERNPNERAVLISFATWLLWGPHPSKPYALLLKLDRIRDQSDAWALVSDEPWYLSQPALSILKRTYTHSPDLNRLVGWLKAWQTELIRPENNRLVQMANQVKEGHQSLDTAIEIARNLEGLSRLEIPHLAAIDEWIQGDLIDTDSAFAEVLAALNYAAAQTLEVSLMRGYAALTLGNTLIDRRPLAEVAQLLEQAIAIGRHLDHPLLLGQALQGLGHAHAAQDHFSEALQYLQEAEEIAHRLPLWTGRKEIVLSLAHLHLEMNQVDLAQQWLYRFDPFPEQLEEVSRPIYRYWFLRGGIAFQQGEMQEAITLLEKARQIAESLGNPRLIHEATQNIARLYTRSGRRQDAQVLLKELANITDEETRIELLETQALFALNQGMWQQSKDLLEQALLQTQQAGLDLYELRTHKVLGYLHNQMEQPAEAHSHWRACRNLLSRIGSWPVEEMEIQLSRAITYNLEGKHREALTVCRDALRRARRLNHKEAVQTALVRLVKICLDMHRLERALSLIRVAEIRVDASDLWVLRGNRATILSLQARTAWAEGHNEEARKLLGQAESIYYGLVEEARQEGQVAPLLNCLYNLGLLYREPAVADLTQSARYFREAVETLEALRLNLAADALQQRFLGDKSYLYRMALESALDINDRRNAIEIAEIARARILGGRIAHLEGLPESLPQQTKREYQQALARFQQALNTWLSLGMGLSDDPFRRVRTLTKPLTLQDRQRCFDEYEKARNALENRVKEIRKQYRDFQPITLLPKPSFDDVQGLLNTLDDAHLAFVHLHMLDDETVALISSTHLPEPLVVHLPFGRAHLGLLLSIWEGSRKSWESKLGPLHDVPEGARKQLESSFGQRLEDFLELLRRVESSLIPNRVETITLVLSRLIWRDLHPQLQKIGITRVVLLPDNVLGLLPIHAVPLDEPAREGQQPSRWVLDMYEVTLAPSVQTLHLLHERACARPAVLTSGVVLAQPTGLPLAAAAASLINKHLRDSARVVWDTESERARLKEALTGEQALLHIDAHGRFDVNNPEQTELKMPYDEKAPRGTPTRWLTLAGISRDLTLDRNRLTVLAACESSLIELARTAEFVGLSAAFLVAGAPAVVAALWPVDELATLLLLSFFYDSLSASHSIAGALRQAQVHLRDLTREEAIAELSTLRDNCHRACEDSLIGTAGWLAFYDVQGTLDNHINHLQREGEVVRRLQERLQGMDREAAAQLLLNEGKTTVDRSPGDTDIGMRLSQLQATIEWQLSDKLAYREWDTETACTWLDVQARYPFAEPYFWSGFQAWGAAI